MDLGDFKNRGVEFIIGFFEKTFLKK